MRLGGSRNCSRCLLLCTWFFGGGGGFFGRGGFFFECEDLEVVRGWRYDGLEMEVEVMEERSFMELVVGNGKVVRRQSFSGDDVEGLHYLDDVKEKKNWVMHGSNNSLLMLYLRGWERFGFVDSNE